MSQPSQITERESPNVVEAPAASRRLMGGALVPLRNSNFCLLVSGQAISTMGDMFYAVALPWFMLTSGQGVQALSALLTAYGLPRIAFLVLGGVLSDRWHPRRVMLLSDIARTVLMGVLASLIFSVHPAFWALCTVSVLLGGFTGLFTPASFSMMPELLPAEDLQAGNALNFSTIRLASSLSPALAGLIISHFVPSIAFMLDTVSFSISAITLFLIRQPSVPPATKPLAGAETASVSADEVADVAVPVKQTLWQFLKSSRLIQVTLIVVIVINVTSGGMLEVALPVLAKGPFAGGAGGFGLLLSAFGLGGLLGSVAAGGLTNLKHRCVTALLLTLVQICAFAALPLTGQIMWAAPVILLAGVTNGLVNVIFFTLIQQDVPRHLLGSIMAAFLLAEFGLYPLSIILGGFVTVQFGPMLMFPLCLVLGLPAVVFGLSQRKLWQI